MPDAINLDSRVRILDDVLFQELQGEAVLLNLNTGVYFGLDPVGTRIWQLLQEDGALPTVAEALLREFDVAPEELTRDLLDLVCRMRQEGLLAAE
jgi:hypothetical protein